EDVQQIFIPPASAKLQQTSSTSSDWIFNITGIKRVDVVGLYVEPIQKQLDSAKQNDLATAQALDKKRLSIQQRMQEKYLPKLSSQPGQFIKLEQVTKDQDTLAQATQVVKATGEIITAEQARGDAALLAKIKEAGGSTLTTGSAARAGSPPGIADTYLIYDIQRRPQISSLMLTAGGGYSAEDKFTLTGSLAGENVLSSFIPADQSISITYTGGNEVQKGEAHFSINPSPSKNPMPHWEFNGFNLDGTYSRDNNQRLGNETGPEFKDREGQVKASAGLSFDSFSTLDNILRAQALDKTRRRTRYTIQVKGAFGFRTVDIDTDAPAGDTIARGQLTTASVSINQQVSHDSMGSPGG